LAGACLPDGRPQEDLHCEPVKEARGKQFEPGSQRAGTHEQFAAAFVNSAQRDGPGDIADRAAMGGISSRPIDAAS